MGEIAIQTGTAVFGASEDTFDVDITAVVLANAFVRIQNVMHASSGPTAQTTTNRNDDDLGCTVIFVDSDTIRFAREASGVNEDVDVKWEIVEYTGAAGGVNEFIVREQVVTTIATATTLRERDISGLSVDTYENLVPILAGVKNQSTTGRSWQNQSATIGIDVVGQEAEFRRNGSSGTIDIAYALVEFTGSNWSVQNTITHTVTNNGTDETETITDVSDWATAFIFGSCRAGGNNNALDENSCTIRPGSSTTTVRFRTSSNATGSIDMVAHVVKNAQLSVEHLDSITGGKDQLPGPTVFTKAYTISAVTLAEASVLALASHNTNGSAYPRGFWDYSLTGTTTLTFERQRVGVVSDFSAQVVDYSSVIAPVGEISGWAIPTIINPQRRRNLRM